MLGNSNNNPTRNNPANTSTDRANKRKRDSNHSAIGFDASKASGLVFIRFVLFFDFAISPVKVIAGI
jgi:hypothetical protein